jgi:hypothetical protein
MASNKDLKELGNSLHRRLLGGMDATASSEICELFLPLLTNALNNRFPNLPDPHLAGTFAIDSLLSYLKHPAKFDPHKGSLVAYLYMDACGDLVNFLEKQKKFIEIHIPFSEQEANIFIDEKDPEALLLEKCYSLAEQAIAAVTDSTDRNLIELLINRERKTERYAEALELAEPDSETTIKEVKRRKDKLKVSLKRRLKKLYGKSLDSFLPKVKEPKKKLKTPQNG